jgi:hypothetical protein
MELAGMFPIHLAMAFWMRVQWFGWPGFGAMCQGRRNAAQFIQIHTSEEKGQEQEGMCSSISQPYSIRRTIPHGNRLHLQLYTDGCADKRDNQVKYLEHVQAIVTLSAPKRGDIQIYLTSPRGTRSTLLAKRQRDTSRTGFKDWAFMTTHNWGENGYGTWSLEIDNDGYDGLLGK